MTEGATLKLLRRKELALPGCRRGRGWYTLWVRDVDDGNGGDERTGERGVASTGSTPSCSKESAASS